MRTVALALTLLLVVSANAAAAALSQAEALMRAEAAARKNGYDLTKFRLSHGDGVLMPGGKAWLFNFVCAPITPPDCGFFAEVQRDSGAVALSPVE